MPRSALLDALDDALDAFARKLAIEARPQG